MAAPRTLMPVHGEMRHMMEHARFATTQGVPQTLVQSDGDIVRLLPSNATKIGNAPVGRLVLDGDVILPSDGSTMNERRKLAINGQISVGVAVAKGRLVGSPQVRVQGVPVEDERDAFIAEAVAAAAKAVDARAAPPTSCAKIFACRCAASRPAGPARSRSSTSSSSRADAMHWTSALAIYVLFWSSRCSWSCPSGLGPRMSREAHIGTAESAPHVFAVGRFLRRTTITATDDVRALLSQLCLWLDHRRYARLERDEPGRLSLVWPVAVAMCGLRLRSG
jgi:predicted secreted protein